jgi:hypothetical protein
MEQRNNIPKIAPAPLIKKKNIKRDIHKVTSPTPLKKEDIIDSEEKKLDKVAEYWYISAKSGNIVTCKNLMSVLSTFRGKTDPYVEKTFNVLVFASNNLSTKMIGDNKIAILEMNAEFVKWVIEILDQNVVDNKFTKLAIQTENEKK